MCKSLPRTTKQRLSGVTGGTGVASASSTVNTSYIERLEATDRHRNARKRKETYCFSKAFEAHEAMTDFTMYDYKYYRPVRTLRLEVGPRR